MMSNLRTFVRFASTQSKIEYYKLLEIPPEATLTEIREAYFKKAKKLHPDINPSEDAKKQFALIQEAYKTLADKDRRIGYDRNYAAETVFKRDNIVPETEKETKIRLEKKREDSDFFHKTKKEALPTSVWTFKDEFGTGARIIKVDSRISRAKEVDPAIAEAEFKNSAPYKIRQKISLGIIKTFKLSPASGDNLDIYKALRSAGFYAGFIAFCFIIYNMHRWRLQNELSTKAVKLRELQS